MERNTWMGWPSRLSLWRSPPDLVYTPIDMTSNGHRWAPQQVGASTHIYIGRPPKAAPFHRPSHLRAAQEVSESI